MAKRPHKPELIFGDFVHDFKELLGQELLSVIVYGSAARGEYVAGKSDINFMVILAEDAIDRPARMMPLIKKWHKRSVSTPLFLTKGYISSSLDSFPIEFLNFKSAYRLIYGEDVLQDLQFDSSLLRLQCERELKGKLLQLRERFLETEGRRGRIEELIRVSLTTFLSIFRAVVFLEGSEPPGNNNELIAAVSRCAGLDSELFAYLAEIRQRTRTLDKAGAAGIMERYIGQVRKLAQHIDRCEEGRA